MIVRENAGSVLYRGAVVIGHHLRPISVLCAVLFVYSSHQRFPPLSTCNTAVVVQGSTDVSLTTTTTTTTLAVTTDLIQTLHIQYCIVYFLNRKIIFKLGKYICFLRILTLSTRLLTSIYNITLINWKRCIIPYRHQQHTFSYLNN